MEGRLIAQPPPPPNGIIFTHRCRVDVSTSTLSLTDILREQRQECNEVRILNQAIFEAESSIVLVRVGRQLPVEYGKLNFALPWHVNGGVHLE